MKSSVQKFIVSIFVLIIYVPVFIWMWDRWFARDSYYSHGILIPFVTGYLIWQKKSVLKNIKPQSSPWGMKLFFVGIAVYLFSALFRVYFTSGFSLIIVLVGLVLNFYGSRILKEILFPLLFLFFMIPLPLIVVVNMSFKLKIFAAHIAVFVLNNNMRIPCIRDGSTIIMRHAHVVVDDVCSGLRSLISLMALGSLFAYRMQSTAGKKIILFLSTIPVAVITNVVRIIFLATVSEIWGAQYIEGPLHDLSGFMVFILAFALLYFFEKMIE